MERNWTDQEIINEAHAIMADKRLRQHQHCAHYDEACSKCRILDIVYPKVGYAGLCKFFETNEQKILREAKEAIAQLETEERKMNFILTLSLNAIEIGLLYLEDFSSRVETGFKRAEAKGLGGDKVRKADRNWIATLKRSYKQMQSLIEGTRRQYTHYVEPQLNKIFMDADTKEYDVQSYDDHMGDAYELAKLLVMYFDRAYNNASNTKAIFSLLESMQGCGVLDEKDFKRYDFRR